MEPLEIDVLLQRPVPIRMRWEDNTTTDYELPRLGVEGLLPWLDEITEQRKENLRKTLIYPNMPKRDKADAEFSIEQNAKAVISDLTVPVQEPAGIKRVLELSIKASSIPSEKQDAVLKHLLLSGHVAYGLAQKLSTLFHTGERRPEPDKPKLPAGINPETQVPLPEGAVVAGTASPELVTTG